MTARRSSLNGRFARFWSGSPAIGAHRTWAERRLLRGATFEGDDRNGGYVDTWNGTPCAKVRGVSLGWEVADRLRPRDHQLTPS